MQSQLNLEADLRYFQAGGQHGEGPLLAHTCGLLLADCASPGWHEATSAVADRHCSLHTASRSHRGALLVGLAACTGPRDRLYAV